MALRLVCILRLRIRQEQTPPQHLVDIHYFGTRMDLVLHRTPSWLGSMPIDLVQAQLGHDSRTLTMDLYGPLPARRRLLVDRPAGGADAGV